MNERDFEPVHPGEILLEEFLKRMRITQYRLAKDISVPHDASAKLCRASAPLLPIRPFG